MGGVRCFGLSPERLPVWFRWTCSYDCYNKRKSVICVSASFDSKCVTSNPAWTPHDLCFYLRQRRRNPVPVSSVDTTHLHSANQYFLRRLYFKNPLQRPVQLCCSHNEVDTKSHKVDIKSHNEVDTKSSHVSSPTSLLSSPHQSPASSSSNDQTRLVEI